MKTSPAISSSRRRAAAFTLPEVMIAMTIFVILLGGVVAANIFGLQMFQITAAKMSATDSVRKSLGKLTDEIRTCKTVCIGDVSNGVFVAGINGAPQTGGGLLINPTTDTNVFTIYFLNPNDQSFRRTTSAGVTTLLASQVTNSLLFSAQDYLGNVLTNNQNNRVIHLELDLYQPKTFGTIASYFVLQTSVTRRAP